jgi:hypothetical protein
MWFCLICWIPISFDFKSSSSSFHFPFASDQSLSILEVEMRKLEEVVTEIVNELNYLKKRETKMRDTNGQRHSSS